MPNDRHSPLDEPGHLGRATGLAYERPRDADLIARAQNILRRDNGPQWLSQALRSVEALQAHATAQGPGIEALGPQDAIVAAAPKVLTDAAAVAEAAGADPNIIKVIGDVVQALGGNPLPAVMDLGGALLRMTGLGNILGGLFGGK